MPKAPPKFVTSIGAWQYTLAKLELKGKLTPNGDPQNYAAACAIYKNVVRKYPAFAIPEPEIARIQQLSLDELMVEYSAGQMFWFDDVLCEAVADQYGNVVSADSRGNLEITAKVLDVDPEGAHRGWEEGKIIAVPPHRCADFVEASV
jgi:hypothetical protein